MSPLAPSTAPTTSGPREPLKGDARAAEKVRAIFSSMSRYISAKTIYTSNNPNLVHFADDLQGAFRSFFDVEKELTLTVEQYRITWREVVVYEDDRKTESLAFLLFKDGIGEITFQAAAKPAELERFVDILRNEIHNPSPNLDVVGRFWQADFSDISYRVFDENTDGAPGEGKGAGSDNRRESLVAGDHPGLPDSEKEAPRNSRIPDPSIESLGTYFNGLVERMHPDAAALEKEQRLQELLEFYFVLSGEELRCCGERFRAGEDRDKILGLLIAMLDFTQARRPPAVVRDILDIIERLVRHIIDEQHVPTVISLLNIQKRLAASDSVALDYKDLPDRIGRELTNAPFLISLGKISHRTNADAALALHYFENVGKDAVPGVCELIANLKDPAMHTHACDTLLTIAGEEVTRIVAEFNLDNPNEARDAVYLLRHFVANEIPPIIRTLMASPDLRVKEHAIDYLALVSSDEAASLLRNCLEDPDAALRARTLSAAEQCRHSMIADKVLAMCFADETGGRSDDELERMFRTVGKLAGSAALAPIRQMMNRRSWLPFANTRRRHDKLLAITALRHIPGDEASRMLSELANDGNNLVRTKAQYVLKQRGASSPEGAPEESPIEPNN